MSADKKNIDLKLSGVKQVVFNDNSKDVSIDPSKLKIGIMSNIILSPDENVISVDFGVRYEIENAPFFECIYRFSFSTNDIGAFTRRHEGDQIDIEGNALKAIVNIAIGTLRGIMVAKTEDTDMANYVLPALNIEEVLKGTNVFQSTEEDI